MSINNKYWLVFTLATSTAFASGEEFPPLPELDNFTSMETEPHTLELPSIPSLPAESEFNLPEAPVTPIPDNKTSEQTLPSFPTADKDPVQPPTMPIETKPAIGKLPEGFAPPPPAMPRHIPESISQESTPSSTTQEISVQTAEAARIAQQLQMLIDKTVTSSHLSKYEVGILADILIEENNDLAEGLESIIPERALVNREGKALSGQGKPRTTATDSYKSQIAELDRQIEQARNNPEKLSSLRQQKRELQLSHRFNLNYSKTEVASFPDKINERDNKHLPAKDTIIYYRPYIYQAIADNNLNHLEELLAFINYQDFLDDHGNNLVMKAAMYNNQRVLEYLVLHHNFSIHTANNYNATPLHVAAYSGNYAMVKFLLGNHASILIEDQSGNTPMDYALANGGPNVASLFEIIDREIRFGDAGEAD